MNIPGAGTSPRANEFLDEFRRSRRSDLALLAATTDAIYWGPRADVREAALDEIVELSTLPENEWWTRNFGDQQSTVITDTFPLAGPGVSGRLDSWSRDVSTFTGRDERRKPAKRARGAWWSTPDPASVCCTYGPGYSLPAVGLSFAEDDFGALEADVVSITPQRELRVREIRDAHDWVQLVEDFPLNVSASRSATWFDNTGIESDWFLPNYAAVSEKIDVIHVSVLAYLGVAGVPLKALGGFTMMAGWNPDATYWLTDDWRGTESTTWARSDPSSLEWTRSV